MNLEAALQENTAAIKYLSTLLASVGHSALTTPTPTPTVAKAKTKVEADANGNPAGTVYFDIPQHKTVHAVKPGDHVPNVPSQVAISAEEYTAKRAEYQKNVKAPAAVEPKTVDTAPIATPLQAAASVGQPEPTFQDVVGKIKELHALVGNEGLLLLLQKHGAANVPGLNGKAPNSVLISETEWAIATAKGQAF